MISNEAKKGGRPRTPNRQGLYAQAAQHAPMAISTVVELLQSKNENIRLGAAKVLMEKCLPDMKFIEGELQHTGPLEIVITEAKHGEDG